MIHYTVIDTSVLVSALLSRKEDAATVQIISKVIRGAIIPLYSTIILKEYQEVLARTKFGFSPDTIQYLLSAIEKYGIFVNPSPSNIVLPDRKDIPFYDLILEKRTENSYLVTGNTKHFPQEAFIVTPRELLHILNSAEQ